MCDGGLVIDLSSFKRIEKDDKKEVARAQAGALVRDLDEATQRFGWRPLRVVVPRSGLPASRSEGAKAV
jgi:FAD/FMN-containing dehydrogenase